MKEGLNEYLQCSFADLTLIRQTGDKFMKPCLRLLKKILAKDRYVFQKKVQEEKKMVYYMSMEFLMGRSLKNNLFNLGLEKDTRKLFGEP